MKSTRKILFELVVVLLALSAIAPLAVAQNPTRRAPTAADWAALAKLPDLTGVWEVALGGGRNRDVAPNAGPSLTPEYAAKRDALRASAPTLVDFAPHTDSTHPGSVIKLTQARHPLLPSRVVVPIDLEPLGDAAKYGNDRLFVYLRLASKRDAAKPAGSLTTERRPA